MEFIFVIMGVCSVCLAGAMGYFKEEKEDDYKIHSKAYYEKERKKGQRKEEKRIEKSAKEKYKQTKKELIIEINYWLKLNNECEIGIAEHWDKKAINEVLLQYEKKGFNSSIERKEIYTGEKMNFIKIK